MEACGFVIAIVVLSTKHSAPFRNFNFNFLILYLDASYLGTLRLLVLGLSLFPSFFTRCWKELPLLSFLLHA